MGLDVATVGDKVQGDVACIVWYRCVLLDSHSIGVVQFEARLDCDDEEREHVEQWTDEIGTGDGRQCVSHVAPRTIPLRMGDGDVTPDGQGDREEDGDGVHGLREEGMEVDDNGPGVTALLLLAVL